MRTGPWSTGDSGHARAADTTNATGSPWLTLCGQTSFGPVKGDCSGAEGKRETGRQGGRERWREKREREKEREVGGKRESAAQQPVVSSELHGCERAAARVVARARKWGGERRVICALTFLDGAPCHATGAPSQTSVTPHHAMPRDARTLHHACCRGHNRMQPCVRTNAANTPPLRFVQFSSVIIQSSVQFTFKVQFSFHVQSSVQLDFIGHHFLLRSSFKVLVVLHLPSVQFRPCSVCLVTLSHSNEDPFFLELDAPAASYPPQNSTMGMPCRVACLTTPCHGAFVSSSHCLRKVADVGGTNFAKHTHQTCSAPFGQLYSDVHDSFGIELRLQSSSGASSGRVQGRGGG